MFAVATAPKVTVRPSFRVAAPVQARAVKAQYKVTLKTPDGEQVIECADDTYILAAAEVCSPWSPSSNPLTQPLHPAPLWSAPVQLFGKVIQGLKVVPGRCAGLRSARQVCTPVTAPRSPYGRAVAHMGERSIPHTRRVYDALSGDTVRRPEAVCVLGWPCASQKPGPAITVMPLRSRPDPSPSDDSPAKRLPTGTVFHSTPYAPDVISLRAGGWCCPALLLPGWRLLLMRRQARRASLSSLSAPCGLHCRSQISSPVPPHHPVAVSIPFGSRSNSSGLGATTAIARRLCLRHRWKPAGYRSSLIRPGCTEVQHAASRACCDTRAGHFSADFHSRPPECGRVRWAGGCAGTPHSKSKRFCLLPSVFAQHVECHYIRAVFS